MAEDDIRPRMRGQLHIAGSALMAVGGSALVANTPTANGNRVATVVYVAGVLAMFLVSAIYHAIRTDSPTKRVFKRIDHGTILLAIAGTYTAVTALGVSGPRRGQLLVGIWIAAAIGVGIQMIWLDAPRIVGALVYVVVGWFAIFDVPAYLKATTSGEFALIALGGLLYTVGGVVYALKRPNPWPATFGFHEVFHAFTVLGAAAHFAAVASLANFL